MAEELDITLGAEVPDELAGGGKKRGQLLIIVLAVILALGAQTLAAYYTISLLFFHNPPAAVEKPAAQMDSLQQDTTVVAEEKIETSGEVFEFADLIVNPAGTMGRRYFVVSMGFEVSNKKVLDEIAAKDAPIRDALITLLAQKNLDYIADVANMESIRSEIQRTVNKFLESGKVVKIYFTGYILQ